MHPRPQLDSAVALQWFCLASPLSLLLFHFPVAMEYSSYSEQCSFLCCRNLITQAPSSTQDRDSGINVFINPPPPKKQLDVVITNLQLPCETPIYLYLCVQAWWLAR